MKKITLIYGGGAIGSFIANCLLLSNHKVFFLCRGENYKAIKNKGLSLKIFDNEKLLKKYDLKIGDNFKVINNLKKIKNIKFDNIFITTKINENLKKIFYNIEPFICKKTLIITPCTSIPFWWFLCLKNSSKVEKKIFNFLDPIFKRNIKRKNLVGMTMWLSGKLYTPGKVAIKHIQRGLPIKEVFLNRKNQVNSLRKDIRKLCVSPFVKNIYSEIFIKSINSLAFNSIALKYKQTNLLLSKNNKAKEEILKILKEGDLILKKNKIKIYQSPHSRIEQTLKSTRHTMSMLYAFKNNKKIELNELWLSFENLSKNLNLEMPFTRKIVREVKSNLNEYH
tara:strand:- start:759 stop:1769 length:1011 start_codon:yes stop_codon:yes gene_type:complete